MSKHDPASTLPSSSPNVWPERVEQLLAMVEAVGVALMEMRVNFGGPPRRGRGS